MLIEKGLIGKEDINWGTDTYQRKSSVGTDIPMTKVNANYIPVMDSGGKFVSSTVEGALSECQVENAIGSNSKSFTNKSGSQRVLGDVVITDINNDDSFTTTTISGNPKILGVVGATIANDASGKVITGGYISVITVDAACARGSFLKSSSTSGKATPVSNFQIGCFAVAMSSSAGPGSVSALLFGSIGLEYLPLTGGTLTGMLKLAKGVDVSSASSLILGSDGNYFDVTGTVTITGIATKGVGTVVTLHFDDIVTITHHATNLVLPGGVNLTTSAGTEITFVEYSNGAWRCIGWLDPSPTGTGNQVLSGTPTLTTPKMDVINEETGATGVTIDGLLIKDGYPFSVNNTSGIKENSIDWANAGGICQFYVSGVVATTTSTSFVTATSIFVYIPPNANTLEIVVERTHTGGTGHVECRLTDGTTVGTAQDLGNPVSYTWSSVLITYDISSKSGWTIFNVDIRDTTGDTSSIRGVMARIY